MAPIDGCGARTPSRQPALPRSLGALEKLRIADHEQCGLGQAFEDGEVAFIKGEGVRGKDLKQFDDVALVAE